MPRKITTIKKRPTSDAISILDRRYYQGKPERQAALEDARLNAVIARDIYSLRTKAGLTQKQLADLVRTSHSVISRLEDADYDGHSLKMLQRISIALHHRLQLRFVPTGIRRKATA